MANEKREVTIKGISPMMMHAFPMIPLTAPEKKTREEQAEHAVYRDPDGFCYVPGVALQRAIVNGASYSKGKGRSTLQKPVAACVLVTPERLSLGVKQYSIDSRPVVIAATKGRVMRHRPRFEEWEVSFVLEWDPDLISEKEIRHVLDDTGSRVGLLEFRPERKGSFGRFMVTNWK